MSVCLYVCFSASISPEVYVQRQSSINFVCTQPTVEARSSAGGVALAICYLFPVLWMTSYLRYLHAMASNRRREKDIPVARVSQ